MSANVRVTLTHPTPSGDQLPIQHARIESRVDGVQQWTEINTVAPPAVDLLVADLAGGNWHFRAIWVDEADRESPPVSASIVVPSDAPSAGTLELSLA